ncbi:MAG: TrkH family potassium uptake protein [Candidatus Nanopelagicales bacterium]|nr:TrkH family potassium uptake protein [Candidatus Nanopelagicales bacterium]
MRHNLHPGQVVAFAFAGAIAVGTILLLLPWSTAADADTSLMDALFTATSAVCVTGLAVVDTGTHWTGFGQVVIMLLIQVGGLGIMTLATLAALLLSHRLGLRSRLIVQTESQAMRAGDVRRVIIRVTRFSLVTEAVVAILLTGQLMIRHSESLPEAAYHGLFHAVSSFNNAGFSTYSDNLVGFAADPFFLITVSVAVIIGGLGFPVVFELLRGWRSPRTWSVLTRVTVFMTTVLLVVGTIVIGISEMTNPLTIGDYGLVEGGALSFFTAVMPRTAGFNAVNIGEMRPESLFFTDLLMFIGGGSAGTAGGIKVTTFGVLVYVVWSQARGESHVNVGRRRIPTANQRQAVSLTLLAMGLLGVATFVLLSMTRFPFEAVLFEAISAFATVGLSVGITPSLPVDAQAVIVLLMFIGRVGPLTVASALALRQRQQRHSLPEERMIVG